MRQKEYTTKAGVKGVEYRPDDMDIVVSNASSVYEGEARKVTIRKGTPQERTIPMITYGLYVSWGGKDIFLKLTKGLKKYLDKCGDLLGKTIVFNLYKNKNYNKTLIGVTVKDAEKQMSKTEAKATPYAEQRGGL